MLSRLKSLHSTDYSCLIPLPSYIEGWVYPFWLCLDLRWTVSVLTYPVLLIRSDPDVGFDPPMDSLFAQKCRDTLWKLQYWLKPNFSESTKVTQYAKYQKLNLKKLMKFIGVSEEYISTVCLFDGSRKCHLNYILA